MVIAARGLSLLIGYALGNFLTAEAVTRKRTGRPCSELGTSGNPGMANVMAHLGFKAGIITLAGDLSKCALACLISYCLFHHSIGRIAVLYAGLGTTLGHDFPIWLKFKGGKGVATSCLAIFLYSPLWGFAANVIGMLVTFATKYLAIGGAVLPAVYVVPMFLFNGREAGFLSLFLALLCLWKHFPGLVRITQGKEEKVDVWGKIEKGLTKKTERG